MKEVDESAAVLCTMSCGDCVFWRKLVGPKDLGSKTWWTLCNTVLRMGIRIQNGRIFMSQQSVYIPNFRLKMTTKGLQNESVRSALRDLHFIHWLIPKVLMDSRLLHCGTANTSDLLWAQPGSFAVFPSSPALRSARHRFLFYTSWMPPARRRANKLLFPSVWIRWFNHFFNQSNLI